MSSDQNDIQPIATGKQLPRTPSFKLRNGKVYHTTKSRSENHSPDKNIEQDEKSDELNNSQNLSNTSLNNSQNDLNNSQNFLNNNQAATQQEQSYVTATDFLKFQQEINSNFQTMMVSFNKLLKAQETLVNQSINKENSPLPVQNTDSSRTNSRLGSVNLDSVPVPSINSSKYSSNFPYSYTNIFYIKQ